RKARSHVRDRITWAHLRALARGRGDELSFQLNALVLADCRRVVTLLDVRRWRGGHQCWRDLGLGQLAAQIGGNSRGGRDRREVLPSYAAVVDHQAAVGGNDIPGP